MRTHETEEHKMQIKPLADNIVVKMSEADEVSKGGILLTSAAKEKPQIAEVVAVGPGAFNTYLGSSVPMVVKEGQKVIINKYSGTEVKLGDGEYIIIKQNDVLAIVE